MQSPPSTLVKEDGTMQKNSRTVLITKNLSDVLFHLKSINELQVIAAGTATTDFGEKMITTRNVPELKTIDKHELYIDFGSAVTLTNMLHLGRTNMPPLLYDAIESIATEPIRNIATLGGNICAKGTKHTLWAPLLALDARLELRSSSEIKYIPFSRFTEVPEGFVLTKIRVPLDEWELSLFRRVGPSHEISPLGAGFAFMVDTQNDIIANIRIVFAGEVVVTSKALENRIIGSRLPLNDRFINAVLEEEANLYDTATKDKNTAPILKAQFLNLLRWALEQLT